MSRTSILHKPTRNDTRRANKKAAAEARDTAVRYAETTRHWAAPKVVAAKDWASPHVEPAMDKVKGDVLPAVAGAVTAALAATEPVRSEAATRGSAAFAALKGELDPPKPKKHRLRKLMMLATVLGAAYAGWKAWASQNSSDDPTEAWTTPSSTSSFGSSPGAVSPVTPVDRPMTDDAAGAGPDEALADAAEESALEDSSATITMPSVTESVSSENSRKAAEAATGRASERPSTR